MENENKPVKFLSEFSHLYAILLVFFIPFPFFLLPYQNKISTILFGDLISFSTNVFFGKNLDNKEISSDSLEMFILVFLLLIISVLLQLILKNISKWETIKAKIFYFIKAIILCYLVTILFKYGFDKIFKKQFYLPEPNILYTPFGQLDKDILYWSTMGTSYTYSVITGILEVIAGLFILIRKTRTIGLILCLGILFNILLINISFDISVKLFSCCLIFFTLVLLSPTLPNMPRFFLGKKLIEQAPEFTLKNSVHSHPIRVSILTFIIGLILIESLYPHIRSGNYNDDKEARPYLHGAYQVISVHSGVTQTDSIVSPIKKIFIHRDGYIIFQNTEDIMHDYKLQIDSVQGVFVLTDYDLKSFMLKYETTADGLQLEYFKDGKQYLLNTKTLDWRQLPILKDELHWFDSGD